MANSNIINIFLSDTAVSPKGAVNCGVQGDDCVCVIKAECEDSLFPPLSDGEQLRVHAEAVTGGGEFWFSGFLNVEDNTVSLVLPSAVSRAGGAAALCFVFSAIDSNGVQTKVKFSPTVPLCFAPSVDMHGANTVNALSEALALIGKYRAALDGIPDGKTVQGEIDELDDKKVDKIEGKGLSANDYTDEAVAEVAKIANKVDKIEGKGLSTNDYTDSDKAEVAKIAGKVDKADGKGLSTNDYTDSDKAEVAKIAGKLDRSLTKLIIGGTDNIDSLPTESGKSAYYYSDTAFGMGGTLPSDIGRLDGFVLKEHRGTLVSYQIMHTGDRTDSKSKTYVRTKSTAVGSWGSWVKLYSSDDNVPLTEKGTFTANFSGTNIQAAYYKVGAWCKVVIPVNLTAAAYSSPITGLPFASAESVSGVCASARTNLSETGEIVCEISKGGTTLVISNPFSYTGNLTFEYPVSAILPPTQTKLIDWDENNNFAVLGTLISKDGNGIKLTCTANAGSRSINSWSNDLSDVTAVSFTAKTETSGAKLKVQIGTTDSEYYSLSADGTAITVTLADLGVTPATGMDINFYSDTASAVITIGDIMAIK